MALLGWIRGFISMCFHANKRWYSAPFRVGEGDVMFSRFHPRLQPHPI